MADRPAKSIVVVGAGYTGLVAAYRLAQAGHRVTVLEHGTDVGGLASGFQVEGAPLERAYHHLFKTDKDILRLTDELGIGSRLEWHTSHDSLYYGGKMYPFTTAGDLIRFTPLSFVNRIRTGLVALYLQKQAKWEGFKHVTAYTWMKKAVGAQATKVIWEPLLRGKFDKYYDRVAMAWLWARIHIRANSKEKGDTEEKLGYYDGGFQVFTDALVRHCEDLGVTIRTGVSIERLSTEDGHTTVALSDGSVERYDATVATVPSGVFSRLVADDGHATQNYLERLSSIDYLGARLLIFSSEQDISPYYWHNINDVDLPFLVFINHTKLVGKERYNGKNLYYIATYLPHDAELFTCSDEDLERRWFDALKVVFPDFSADAVREKHHFRFRNAQHIVGTDYEGKIPDHRTPLPGTYLCNFSQIYPEDRGTNYAVRDGERIAADVLADLAAVPTAD